MDEKQREQVALFRFGLISPILHGMVPDRAEYLARQSMKIHQVPGYGAVEYTPRTMELWLRQYVAHGFDALKPKQRSDRGESRVISTELKQELIQRREQSPDVSVTLFYERMLKQGIIPAGEVSYTSVYRLLKRMDLGNSKQRKEPERKRFQFEKVNALWQADFSQGPYLRIGKKKVETHLFAFIDDASRLVPYASFTTDETFESLKLVLKQALLRRGIPAVLYSDNGKIYRSQLLQWACASLGIALVHTRPYDPQAKGKIERYFLTVKRRFIEGIDHTLLGSLDSLNQAFHTWLEQDYNQKTHSGIGMSPLDFYLSQASSLKMVDDPSSLEPIFLRREQRKVRHDATLSLRNLLFEVPPRFIGQSIEVRFDPLDLSQAFIYEDGKLTARITPVNLVDNSRVKRENQRLRLASFDPEVR